MSNADFAELKVEYGDELKIGASYHFHDEDAWNEIDITYRGIIVGSELVDIDFVKSNINKVVESGLSWNV